jgi:hypothetical protein
MIPPAYRLTDDCKDDSFYGILAYRPSTRHSIGTQTMTYLSVTRYQRRHVGAVIECKDAEFDAGERS